LSELGIVVEEESDGVESKVGFHLIKKREEE
jgi:hypothetical protein